jgi:hypothetical protein
MCVLSEVGKKLVLQRDKQFPIIFLLSELLAAQLFVTARLSSGKCRQCRGEVGRVTLLLVMTCEDNVVLIPSP